MEKDNESTVREFVRDAKEILGRWLKEYGLVMYSHRSTLRRNPVFFWGVNPGCDPGVKHPIRWTIGESLDHFEDGFKVLDDGGGGGDFDLIRDQRWSMPGFRRDYEKGQAPYQRRTRWLLEEIGCRDALVTNLFFRQTRNVEQLREVLDEEFVSACWRVHEGILRITEAKVIVTCSDVVTQMLRGKFGLGATPVSEIRAGHAGWKCRHWSGEWRGRRIEVAEIPHFSRYDVTKESRRHVLDWAKGIVDSRVAD